MTSLAFVLRLNAASCLGFGALFVVASEAVAVWLGKMPPQVVFWLGLGLVWNGGHLLLAARRPSPRRAEVLWFVSGDMLWWLATLGLIATGVWLTTPAGIALAGLVAVGVAGLGAAQAFLWGQHRAGRTAGDHWRRIGRSWMALPLWVKLWLAALNAVFLAAPSLLTWEAARVVLLGYVASGPLLLAFAGGAGGLTRHMGIAHLVTFVPMLGLLLTGTMLEAQTDTGFAFAMVFAAMVGLCLALDLYDLLRWLQGDRAVIGAGNEVA
jgi:hypothetical protein